MPKQVKNVLDSSFYQQNSEILGTLARQTGHFDQPWTKHPISTTVGCTNLKANGNHNIFVYLNNWANWTLIYDSRMSIEQLKAKKSGSFLTPNASVDYKWMTLRQIDIVSVVAS